MLQTVEELEEALSSPARFVVKALDQVKGDILVLGIGGKMGPSLARMAKRAAEEAGAPRRVIGVSRFHRPGLREGLEADGIETISGDLLDPGFVQGLPDAENVVFMAGRKFGTSADGPATWATNTFLPSLAAARFRGSRILAFSTGNVYPMTPISSEGPREDHPLEPAGEYGWSCLGRERVLEHFSRKNGTPVSLIRLNYAIDLRYGVLVDLARKILGGEPIDLSMGCANVIWQGDANAFALASLPLAASPPSILNVTGPKVSIRDLALRLGRALGKEPLFQGREEETALLSNGSRAWEIFGPPPTSLGDMIAWTADWLLRGGPTYDLPTHFQSRDGIF